MFIRTLLNLTKFDVLLGLGITLIAFSISNIFLDTLQKSPPPFPNAILTTPHKIPETINFPKYNHAIPITPAFIQNQQMPVATNSATYLIGSGTIGELGNIVIYAHNQPELFNKLHQMSIGETFILTNKHISKSYKINQIYSVSALDTEIIKATNFEQVTLFTCQNWHDSKRLVVLASPAESNQLTSNTTL